LKEIEVSLDEKYKGDNLWILRPALCPTGNPIQSCMGGRYNSRGQPYIEFVCRHTDAECARVHRDGKVFQPCRHDEAQGGMGAGNQAAFGNATVRHATPEDVAAGIAKNVGHDDDGRD
jgi:hypothetical protein